MPPRTMVYCYLLDLNRDLWFGVVGVAHEPAVDAGDERELREEVFVCFLFFLRFVCCCFDEGGKAPNSNIREAVRE